MWAPMGFLMYNETIRPQKEVILCEDGTNTLFSKEFNEPYHSTKDGALHESLEKYVKPSLTLSKNKTELTILDICFGLGYNTFATLYYIKQQKLVLEYTYSLPNLMKGLYAHWIPLIILRNLKISNIL